MRSTICLAKSPTIAWWNCDGFTIGATPRRPAEICAAWLLRWQEKYPKLCAWVEENIEETLTFYRLPESITNISKAPICLSGLTRSSSAEPMSFESFPMRRAALRLIRALAVEIHEDWIEAHRYLNMEMLREQRKQLQLLEAA